METAHGTARPLQSQQTGPEEEEDRHGWQDGDSHHPSSDPGTSRPETRGHKRSKGQHLPAAKRRKRTPSPQLNYDVLVLVFRYLDTRSKQRAAQVCRLWRDAAYLPSLWRRVEARVSLPSLCPSAYPSLGARAIPELAITRLGGRDELQRLLLFVPHLRSLKVLPHTLTGSSIKQALSCPFRCLEVLYLQLDRVGPRFGHTLPQHLTSLHYLCMQTNRPRNVTVTREDLPYLPHLKCLWLSGFRLQDDDAKTVVERCPNLELVSLSLSSRATLEAVCCLTDLPGIKHIHLDVPEYMAPLMEQADAVKVNSSRYFKEGGAARAFCKLNLGWEEHF